MLPGYKLFGVLPLYYFFHAFALACTIPLQMHLCRKYNVPRLRFAALVAVVFAVTYAWMMVLFWASTGFRYFGGQNTARVWIWIPMFVYLAAKLVKVDWRKACDIFVPGLAMLFGIGHFGCVFAGCCHGYASSWGIYNAVVGERLFPVQICESVTCIAIAGVILYIMRRKNYQTNGWMCPLGLMMAGFARFFWEFFRDNDKVIGMVSELAIHAAVCFVVGAVWLIVLKYRETVAASSVSPAQPQ